MSWGPYPYDYHEFLKQKSQKMLLDKSPLTEKEQKDLELLNLAKHYSHVLRKKIWFNET